MTVCPMSNTALKVIDGIESSPVAEMLGAGISATINSDDPAYFGGYIGANYQAVADGLKLDRAAMKQLAINSFAGSFLSEDAKADHIKAINDLP